MRIFGIEITVKKAGYNNKKDLFKIRDKMDSFSFNRLEEQLTNKSLFNAGYISPEVIIARTENEFIRQIVWPKSNHLDELQMVKYNKAKHDLLKAACSYGGGHFTICPVHDFESLGCYVLDGRRKQLYDELRNLHCVDFVHMPISVRVVLVQKLNELFSNNSDFIDGEIVEEDIKLLQINSNILK